MHCISDTTQYMLHTSEPYIVCHVGGMFYSSEYHGLCFLIAAIHGSATPAYSSLLEHTRAYSSILESARAYARVLGVQSPIASAMEPL